MTFYCRMGTFDEEPTEDDVREGSLCALCQGRGGSEHCKYSNWDGRTDEDKKAFMKEIVAELSKPENVKKINKERRETNARKRTA